MNKQGGIDEKLKRNLGEERMTRAESEAVWERVEDGLAASPGGARETAGARTDRRFGLAAAALAVAAAVAVVALSPWSGSGGGGGLNPARLESASASEVLGLAAESARAETSLVPAPGQVFLASESQYLVATAKMRAASPDPIPAGPMLLYAKEFWIAPDGKGVEVQKLPDSRTFTRDGGFDWGMVDRYGVDFGRIGVDPEEGWEWSNALTTGDLAELPTEPEAALAFVRRADDQAVRNVGPWQARSRATYGKDLSVLMRTVSLLTTAPLDGEQRAALFDVILTAPDWFRSAGSARTTITNEGATETVDGRPGMAIRIRTEARPDSAVARLDRAYGIDPRLDRISDLIVDPEAGRVLEMRSGQVGLKPMSWVTWRSLELRSADEMPEPDPR